jgi:hypothetical protein
VDPIIIFPNFFASIIFWLIGLVGIDISVYFENINLYREMLVPAFVYYGSFFYLLLKCRGEKKKTKGFIIMHRIFVIWFFVSALLGLSIIGSFIADLLS